MTATTGSGDAPRDDRETGARNAPYGSDGQYIAAAGSTPVARSDDAPAPRVDGSGGIDGSTVDGSTVDGSTVDHNTVDHNTVDNRTPDNRTPDSTTQDSGSTPEPYAESPSAPTPSFAAGPAPIDRSEDGPDTGAAVDPSPAGEGARHPSPYGPPPTRDAVPTDRYGASTGPAEEPQLYSSGYGSTAGSPADLTSDAPGTYQGAYAGTSAYPSSADTTDTARYPSVSIPPTQDRDAQAYGSAPGYPGQDAPTTAIPGPADYAPSVPGHSPLVPAAAEPMVVPPPAGAVPPSTGTGRDPGGRAVAAVISTLLGALLVAGGLYLVGEFGSRLATTMLDTGTTGSVRDIILTIGGGVLILVAVVLNGWSPWSTLLPGIALTGAGVWSVVSYDGADRIAGFVDLFFDSGQLLNWGVTAWILIIGVTLLGASISAIIARAAGRTRGRP